MANGSISMSDVELFKELGTYERHFNQIQNVCRGFASTWLLAAFGAFGYIITNRVQIQGIVDYKLVGSLLALSGATGIFLLWLLDVLVYHNLLLAVTAAREALEEKGLPRLDFSKRRIGVFGIPFVSVSARWGISLFYGLPAVFLSLVALVLNFHVARSAVTCAIWIWCILALFAALLMVITTRSAQQGE
jgi:hypothetical protein